jgi:hypothetical protein
VTMGRFAGIGLLALGINAGAVLGLFVINVAAVILFTWVGVTTATHGFLLWPAAIRLPVLQLTCCPYYWAGPHPGVEPSRLVAREQAWTNGGLVSIDGPLIFGYSATGHGPAYPPFPLMGRRWRSGTPDIHRRRRLSIGRN